MASQSSPSQPFHWQYSELDDHNFQIRGHTLFYAVVLFAIILLLTLLLLYARWVCTIQRLPITFTTHTPPHAPPYLPHSPTGQKGLDAAAIAGIPIVLYRKEKETIEECSICLGVIEEGEKVKVLPWCGHCYHSECVDRWLLTQSICPLCRASFSLRVDSLNSNHNP